MTKIKEKVLDWLKEQTYEVNSINTDADADIYQCKVGTSHPVALIFPNKFEDQVIIQGGINISGRHLKTLQSITDPVEKQRIMDELNYEIMSNTNVGSVKNIEDGIIRGVQFQADLFLDGMTKTGFFNKMVYVRSAILKFNSYINKEL